MMTGGRSEFNLLNLQRSEYSKVSPLSPDEEKQCIGRIRTGDSVARDQLILSNLNLVLKISSRFRYSSVSEADIRQAGVRGLISAVDKYDAEKDSRFSDYARVCITNEINQSFRKWFHIKLPIKQARLLKNIKRAQEVLNVQYGYFGYSPNRIADLLIEFPDYKDRDFDDLVKDIEKIMPFTLPVASADELITVDNESTSALIDGISDEENIATRISESEFIDVLINALNHCGIDSDARRSIVFDEKGDLFERRSVFLELAAGNNKPSTTTSPPQCGCPFSRRFRWLALSVSFQEDNAPLDITDAGNSAG